MIRRAKKVNSEQIKLYRLIVCPICETPNPPFFPLTTKPPSRNCHNCKNNFTLDMAKETARKKLYNRKIT